MLFRSDTTVTREITKVVTQHLLDVGQNMWRDGVVQSVAAVVKPLPPPLERPRVATHDILLLNQRDSCFVGSAQLVRRTAARRATTQHGDVRKTAHSFATRRWSTWDSGARSRRGEGCGMSRGFGG